MSIVISDSVVLTEDDLANGINENNPRIGIHSILVANNTFSTEADPDFPLINISNPATYLRWKGETTGEQSITVTLGVPETINYFGLAGHNLGSSGATIVLQQLLGSPETWHDVSEERLLGNDYAFVEEFADATSKRFRLLITPGSAIPEIAVLYIGQILRVQRRIQVGHNPITLNRKTEVSTGRSESGQYLGRVKRSQSLGTSVGLRNLTPTWLRTKFEPFMTDAETRPFFWAGRPGEYPNEVAFCWLANDPQPTNQLSNGMMAVDLSLKGQR